MDVLKYVQTNLMVLCVHCTFWKKKLVYQDRALRLPKLAVSDKLGNLLSCKL